MKTHIFFPQDKNIQLYDFSPVILPQLEGIKSFAFCDLKELKDFSTARMLISSALLKTLSIDDTIDNTFFTVMSARENSRHFATPPTVSP